MYRWSHFALATALIFLVIPDLSTRAFALEYNISKPVVHDNLAVYFAEGGELQSPAIISLDEAAKTGAVKIYRQDVAVERNASNHGAYVHGPVAVENLSSQPIFIQLGDLVRGGFQDQVMAQSMLLSPGSGRISIDTFCVDPFRTTARDGESADFYSAPGALFPWRLAKISAVAAGSASIAVRGVGQSAIWWSIDTIRSKLTRKLGVPLEPVQAAHWRDVESERVNVLLSSRRLNWKSSLPLSLENLQLAEVLQPYADAIEAAGKHNNSTIGAIFVINGRIEGAEVYHSHALFEQSWPKLLRAYATQAIALSGEDQKPLPDSRVVREFLTAAEQAKANDVARNPYRESHAVIYSETVASNGDWIYRSYLPKYATDALEPEGMIVNMLEAGAVDGRSIERLDDTQMVVLHRHPSGNRFSAGVENAPENTSLHIIGEAVESVDDTSNKMFGILGLVAFYLAIRFAPAFISFLVRLARFAHIASQMGPKLLTLWRERCRIVMFRRLYKSFRPAHVAPYLHRKPA